MKTSHKFRLVLGALLILAGLTVFYRQRQTNQTVIVDPKAVMAASTQTPSANAISGKATRIVIPSIGIDNQVVDGYYNAKTGTWTLYGDKAQFATITQRPNNESGLTFIYGHNNKKVFYNLPKIQPGAELTLYTDNNHVFTYKYRDSVTTKPEDSSLFNYQGKPELVLQTCTGAWYQNRTLYSFDLVEVK